MRQQRRFLQITLASLFVLLLCGFAQKLQAADGSGPYCGQTPPGDEPTLFAPGIVSDGLSNRDIAITADGTELYYAVNLRNFEISTIMVTRQIDGRWSDPEVAPFAVDPGFKYLEPAISPDGDRFFYVSAAVDSEHGNDIWVMDRQGDGWSKARKLGPNINTDVAETFPSLTNDGTLYFSRASDNPQIEHIYRSRLVDGTYAVAEQLPANVNCGQTQFNAFVARDESYVIVSVYGRDDTVGSIDYYIVYRNRNDEWSEPVNMGDKINTPGGREYSAYVTRDGKYLFFMSTRSPDGANRNQQEFSAANLARIQDSPENGNSDIYWVDAAIIEDLRPAGF